MLTEKLLEREVYIIGGDKFLVYAPLTRYFCLFDDEITLEEIDEDWMAGAKSLENVPDFIKRSGFVFDKEKIRLRLNITSGCNSNCDYCSVSAGNKRVDMSEQLALKSVYSFVEYAKFKKARELEIVFSGGEPTLRTSFIKSVINFARDVVKNNSIKLNIKILTNGLFSMKDFEILVGMLDDVQVSWDGFIKDNTRYGGNKEKEKLVWDNIGLLAKMDLSLNVLVVVSEINFLNICEIVDQLNQAYGLKNIFLSLKESIGKSGCLRLNYRRLGEIYINLWKKYQRGGVEINLTGTDIHSISPFPCSVPIPNYSVSPDGCISACAVTFNDKSILASVFNIGRVGEEGIKFDDKALERVRSFNVLNMPACGSCFAKWHCRGGCVYAKKGNWFNSLDHERCEMIRFIIKEKLREIISQQF